MENAEQRLLTYSPKKAAIAGNKLIDQLNNNSPQSLKLSIDPSYFRILAQLKQKRAAFVV